MTLEFAKNWASRTEEILLREMRKEKLKDSGKLEKGLSQRVITSGDAAKIEFYFRTYGRFQDMGVGREAKRDDSELRRLLTTKKRKPRQWYSKPFFGRISSLYGAVGFSIAETAMATLRQFSEKK